MIVRFNEQKPVNTKSEQLDLEDEVNKLNTQEDE